MKAVVEPILRWTVVQVGNGQHKSLSCLLLNVRLETSPPECSFRSCISGNNKRLDYFYRPKVGDEFAAELDGSYTYATTDRGLTKIDRDGGCGCVFAVEPQNAAEEGVYRDEINAMQVRRFEAVLEPAQMLVP